MLDVEARVADVESVVEEKASAEQFDALQLEIAHKVSNTQFQELRDSMLDVEARVADVESVVEEKASAEQLDVLRGISGTLNQALDVRLDVVERLVQEKAG